MFERYAIYYTPQGSLADTGAAWLGWDLAKGQAAAHPRIAGLDIAALTQTPRKYGLHGTIKPPFGLANGTTPEQLKATVETLCDGLAPVAMEGLQVADLAGFIALKPIGDQIALARLAAQVVMDLDHFRAAPSTTELARRRQAPLTPAQEQHLIDWGYPYVMDAFRFHITLTGRTESAACLAPITSHFTPHLPAPFYVDSLTIAGQATNGMFHEICRFSLKGGSSG